MATTTAFTLPLNTTTYWVQLHHDGLTGLTVTCTNTATGESYSGAINTVPQTGFTRIPSENPRLRLGTVPDQVIFETQHIANLICDAVVQQNQDPEMKRNKRMDYCIWLQEQMRTWSQKIKVEFAGSIVVNAGEWTEVDRYARVVNLPRNFSCLQITLDIPFTGNEFASHRSRIQLLFDNTPICDATMYSQHPWQLIPVNMHGIVKDVIAGDHTLTVRALVSGGSLRIPWYNGSCVEATVAPPIFATYNIIGFP
jgi:hypothetical protein